MSTCPYCKTVIVEKTLHALHIARCCYRKHKLGISCLYCGPPPLEPVVTVVTVVTEKTLTSFEAIEILLDKWIETDNLKF